MKMAKLRPGWVTAVATILLALCLTPKVSAHTSVERIRRIASNGTTVGPEGFARGYWPRLKELNYYDEANTYRITNISQKLIPAFQRTSNYTQERPPLTAAPGDLLALQYLENGHVTLWMNAPLRAKNRGTVYVYGTYDLNPDANLLDVHYQWNAQGTGGDGKGKLIATRNFDDGRCYQDNVQWAASERRAEHPITQDGAWAYPQLFCQNDIALPTDLQVGKPYTLVWVWDWPQLTKNVTYSPSSAPGAPPGDDGAKVVVTEIYTTVIDINIVDPCDDVLGTVKAPTCTKGGARQAYVVKETNLNFAAIQEQLKNMFIVDVTHLIGTGASNPAPAANLSTPPSSGSSTASSSHSGRIKTMTVTESVVVTTVTVQPGAPFSTSATAASSATSRTTLVVTTSVTATEATITTTPSSSPSAIASGTTSTVGPTTSTDTGKSPTVTRFWKDSKPGAAGKNRRREVGQWGFGRGQDA